MRFPIKNPLAGLILRMFNLPTGTILINVWIKVGRLRLYLHQPSPTWKKPDEVRLEIGGLYLKFYSEQGCEPHYADCVIRWCDTLETVEVRIALAMDSDTEKDDEIFFYCNSLEDLKSLTDKGGEDFTVAGCLDFGIYEELLQTT